MSVPDPYLIAKALEGLIRTIPQLGQRIYTGYVPGTLPTVNGYTLPYCVLWPGAGAPHEQKAADGAPYSQGQVFRFTTTVAATDVWAVIQVTRELKATLTGARVGNGVIHPALSQEAVSVQVDRDVSPVRHYLPLTWTLQTTRNPTP